MCAMIIPGTRRVTLQLDSLPGTPRTAVEQARGLGFDGIGISAARGTFSPANMGQSAVRDLRHVMERNGLYLSHLAADIGRSVFSPESTDEVAERAMRITELARQLDASAVTMPVGMLPDAESEQWAEGVEVLRFLAVRAGSLDLTLALATSPSGPGPLMRLIDETGSDSARICLSPGPLILGNSDVPQAVTTLKPLIDMVVVRDVYVGSDGVLQDAAFGEGAVPWPDVVDAVTADGFSGFFTVRRAATPDSPREVRKALEFVRTHGLLL